MVFERTSYLPKPGRFAEVLALRHRACAVRREIGLASGDVLVERGAGGLDRVHWQCRFSTAAAQEEDLTIRDGSDAFRAVREEMQKLVDGFERQVLAHDASGGSVLRPVPLDDVAIAPEEVEFPSGDRTLKGYLYLPPGPAPHPAMVMNHGSGIVQGTTEVCRPGVAAFLMAHGIAAFLPHRRGYGNSPGTPWREDVSADYGTETYDAQLSARLESEAEDVVAALGLLESRTEIDADHIGVMGSSFGGTVTLLAAASCARFRCAVEFAGAAMNWERAPGLRATMHAAAKRLTRPILFIQAANDYSTAPTPALAETARTAGVPGVEARIYPAFGLTKDEGHFFYKEGPHVWGPHVARFLERWL